MSTAWTPLQLLDKLRARGAHPALYLASETDVATVASAKLADAITDLARRLRAAGVAGQRIGLCGPSSEAWIVAALAVIVCGGTMVPLDDQWDALQFETALTAAKIKLLIAPAARLAAAAGAIARQDVRTLRLDDPAAGTALPPGDAAPLAERAPDAPIMLAWTSGTTGQPKLFPLTVANVAANVEALVAQNLVDETDRALLPLPLYHAYPFIVGVLTTLTIGTAIVLPAGATGPLIVKALRNAEATALIGVPRLYEAIVTVLDSRMANGGAVVRVLWRGAFALVARLERAGIRIGPRLFAPIRRGVAPKLRLLVAGGAKLDQAVEDRLTTLGWTVLTGYGLAETASMFTGNLPRDRRSGSAGKPLGGGAVRIADPDASGVGEVQLRGPAVTSGYLDNAAANAASFTEDGWFRTGDLGFVDPAGFLFITGRAKELIVLGGGKKISPEELEKVYAGGAGIAELGILESGGALVALVRPDMQALRERGVMNPRDGVDVALTGQAQALPSYERLAGFALTENPLPRTRLGKLRRFLLPQLYAEALAGTTKRQAHPLTEEDLALLRDPVAGGLWDMLQQRYPGQAIDLDVSLALELNLDSFGWMELALSLQDRFGMTLSETDIAGMSTIRDLLQVSAARRGGSAPAAPRASLDLDRWLAPTTLAETVAGRLLVAVNWTLMRAAFRLRPQGLEHLPLRGGFVLTPNHVSDLDPLALAGALPWRQLRRIHFAGDYVRLFSSKLSRAFCRAAHLFPVDEMHPDAALTAATRVLRAGETQVWFPEGWRSPDGQCRRFMPGIGQLLRQTGVPAVPVWIDGAFKALPRSARTPKLVPITVIFGEPVAADVLCQEGEGRSDDERIAEALRRRVIALAPKP